MPIPIPENYGEIKVPFNQLSEGDFLDASKGGGILEEIVVKGCNQNFASFILTETGGYYEGGYGVKKVSVTAPAT